MTHTPAWLTPAASRCGVTDAHKANCQPTWSAPGTCAGSPSGSSGSVVRGRCNRHSDYASPLQGVACQRSHGRYHNGYVTAFKFANQGVYNGRCGECLRVKSARGEAFLTVVDECGGNQDLDVAGQVGDMLVGNNGIVDCEYEVVDRSRCMLQF